MITTKEPCFLLLGVGVWGSGSAATKKTGHQEPGSVTTILHGPETLNPQGPDA